MTAQAEKDAKEKVALQSTIAAAESTGANTAAQIVTLTSDRDKIKEELARISEELAAKTQQVTALTASNEEFKRRLENLLNVLLVDPRLRDMAARYMAGEGEEPPEELKEPSADLCAFFKYLTTVVNLQMRKLTSSNLGVDLKLNIQQMYDPVPPTNPEELLKELTQFFQEIFVHISRARTIQTEGFRLEGAYPQIVAAFGGPVRADLRDGAPKSQIFLNELGPFGFLTKILVAPEGESLQVKKTGGVGISREFLSQNPARVTPIVVIGIKYIQLLSNILNSKYASLAGQCGIGQPPIAIESEVEEMPHSPTLMAATSISDDKAKASEDFKRQRGDFNTISSLNLTITKYTVLIQTASNIRDPKYKYRQYFLELLLGLYKNLYDNQRGKSPRVEINTETIKKALYALGYKPVQINTPDKIEAIMTKFQMYLPL